MVFGRLSRKVKSLLGREQELGPRVSEHRRGRQAFALEDGELFFHLRPLTADLEAARGAARTEQFSRAAEAASDHFRDRIRPGFFLHHAASDLILPLVTEHRAECRESLRIAELALGHTFAPLGSEPFTFGSSIDWFSDFQGRSWVYGHVEDLRHQLHRPTVGGQEELGPVEVTWEFNRHAHFVDMGRAYWMTGREPLVSEFIVQAVDWSERNPAMAGINWLDPETVAVRAVNWLLALHLFVKSPQLRGDALCRLLQALLVHGAVLANHLEEGDGRGELACASALLIVSLTLPELSSCGRWVDLATGSIGPAAAREMGRDGFHKSGASALHRQTLEWLLLPLALHRLNRSEPPRALLATADNAVDALLQVVPPNRLTPEFGASWANAFLGRHGGAVQHTRRLLALGAVALNRGDLRAVAGELPSELFWWLGPDAAQRYEALAPERPSQLSRNFSEAGFVAVRDGWATDATWCVLRGIPETAASQASSPPPASLAEHDDYLSLVLSLEGEPVIMEPGAPPLPGHVRDLFSVVSSHSAPRVGREREPLCSSRAEGGNLLCHTSLDDNAHGTVLRASRPVWFMPDQPWTLTRDVLVFRGKKRVALRDRLDGSGEVHFESNLLLAPHLDVLMRGDMGCLLRGKKLQARIVPLFPGRFRYELRKGSFNPFGGWVWSDAGKPAPAHRLRYYARLQAPLTLYLWLVWDPNDTKVPRPEDLEKMFGRR